MAVTLDGQVELATPWSDTPLLHGDGTAYEIVSIGGLGVPAPRTNDLDLLKGGVYGARDIPAARTLEYDIEVVPSGANQAARDADLATRLGDLLTAWSPWPGNLLSPHQASLEDSTLGTAGYAIPPGSNAASIARTTAQAAHGVAALAITSDANGATVSSRTTPLGAGAVPVLPGQTYTGLASFRAAATARTARVFIQWWSASGSDVGLAGPGSASDSTTSWTQVATSAQAPANARFASLDVQTLANANGEVHYVDKASIHPGTSTTWRMPGDVDFDLTYKVIGQANNRKVTGRPRGAPMTWDVPANMSRIFGVTTEFFVPSGLVYDATTLAVVRY